MEDQQRVAATAADWLTKKNEYPVAVIQSSALLGLSPASTGRVTHSMPCPFRAHAAPMPFPCHAVPLIHTCHAAPLPCSDSAVSFVKVRVVAGNIRTASPTV